MANIYANLYDGHLDIGIDCSGAIKCQYALWSEMPIDDDEHCSFRSCGSCRLVAAQIVAVEKIKRRLSEHIRALKNEDAA